MAADSEIGMARAAGKGMTLDEIIGGRLLDIGHERPVLLLPKLPKYLPAGLKCGQFLGQSCG